MIINSVRVQNFRSIRDEVLPCDRLIAVVGPNGSGKSSFLRALEMFYAPVARYCDEDFFGRDLSQEISVTVTFTDLTTEEQELFSKYVEAGHLPFAASRSRERFPRLLLAMSGSHSCLSCHWHSTCSIAPMFQNSLGHGPPSGNPIQWDPPKESSQKRELDGQLVSLLHAC